MSHHTAQSAKFPGLDRVDPVAYDRGFACGYAHGARGAPTPPSLVVVKGKITTGHGTGFRHGYIQGARDRREGKVK